MKLTIFWEDYLHYHVARVAALYQLAREEKHEVHAVALRPKSPELPLGGYHDLLENQIRVLSVDSATDSTTDSFALGGNSSVSKKLLLDELNQTDPDVVAIVGYANRVSRAALGWCRYHKRGSVLIFESQVKDYPRSYAQEWLKGRLVRLYDAALVSGDTHAEYAATLGMPPAYIFKGCSIVDNEFWQQNAMAVQDEPQRWRTHYGLPEKFFLTACRFVSKKNLTGLIDAYAAYVARTDDVPWPLVIVGDGDLAPNLRKRVSDLDLAHLVHFPGYLSAEKMAHVYGLASVFILASAFSEQWGLVVNEAMAAGLPVVVSNICGSAPELVVEGTTGFCFDPMDETQLTELLLKTSSAGINLEQIGRNAQQHIQMYSPQHFAQELFNAAQVAMNNAETRNWPIWPAPRLWL